MREEVSLADQYKEGHSTRSSLRLRQQARGVNAIELK